MHTARPAGLMSLPRDVRKGLAGLPPTMISSTILIAQDGDITLCELRDALFDAHDVKAHIFSIDALLRRLGFRFKKIADGSRATAARCEAQA